MSMRPQSESAAGTAVILVAGYLAVQVARVHPEMWGVVVAGAVILILSLIARVAYTVGAESEAARAAAADDDMTEWFRGVDFASMRAEEHQG